MPEKNEIGSKLIIYGKKYVAWVTLSKIIIMDIIYPKYEISV
jgi:hypothetical protein